VLLRPTKINWEMHGGDMIIIIRKMIMIMIIREMIMVIRKNQLL